jgi:hypothetical protein
MIEITLRYDGHEESRDDVIPGTVGVNILEAIQHMDEMGITTYILKVTEY